MFSRTILFSLFFFFNDTATTEIYTLSLHDALPIFVAPSSPVTVIRAADSDRSGIRKRSEEHTSELQSLRHLVCRLLLEKKNHQRGRADNLTRSSRGNAGRSIRCPHRSF